MSVHKQNKAKGLPQRTGLASAIGFGLASLAGTALAAETSERKDALKLGDVVIEGARDQGYKVDKVSSPKQTAPLLDTPQTISVIPERLFREQGARNLTDVLKNTPGISFEAGENGFSTNSNNFSLRGFDTSGNIFVDGSRDSGSYSRDVFNIEQVEVVKGPASDNGRGGGGGYINMVTKTPGLSEFVNGSVSYGFDDYDSEARKRTSLDTNQVLNDSTAVRLNLVVEDSGVAGREHAEKNSWGLAPSLAFGLGTDTRAIFAYEHLEQNDRPDFGVPAAMVHGMKGTQPYNSATSGADRDNFYGLASDFDDTTVDALLARFEYDLTDDVTLSNQTRWARVDRQARFTVPTGFTAPATVTSQTQYYDRVNTSLTNMTNLAATFNAGSVKHTLASGLELTREESEAGRFAGRNPGNTNVFDPNEDRSGAVSGVATETNDVTIDTVALYLYDTVEFNEQWEMTAGLRLENYQVRIDSRNAAGASTGSVDGLDDTEFTVGGKVGLVYKPAQNGSIYAAAGVSTMPPGSYLSDSDISRTGDNAFPGFVEGADPIKVVGYELGTKWDFFDNRLSTTAALFYTEKRDVPIVGRDVAAGDPVGTNELKGYGEQIVKGIELGASGKITDAWDIYGGIVFMDSERKHSAYLDQVRRAGTSGSGDYGTALRTDGDELAFTPKMTANLWTTYRLPMGLTLGGGMQHSDSTYLGRPDNATRIIPNGRYGKLPSYTIFNAMASYAVNENVDVRLNIDNLTDEEYAASSNWNGTRVFLGNPRTYLVSADFRF